MQTLRTKGTYLAYADGTPFFYLADTAWELAHKANREEVETYFATRAAQGFTAVQIVVLAEFDGLTVPNAHGRVPFLTREGEPDPLLPDTEGPYSYWDHLDFIVETAQAHGICVVLLPTWGDKYNLKWGRGPVVFHTPEVACKYATWLARRYKDTPGIIWMLGGDRPLEKPRHREIVAAFARGIRWAGDTHLITFHPAGHTHSGMWLADAPYIDFHTSQTGHTAERCYDSDRVMAEMRALGKPYLDSEPRYEDHPACFDETCGYFWDADDVRVNLYRNLLAGAAGHTYGNHCIWSMTTEGEVRPYFPYTWKEALTHPGACQVGHAKTLRLTYDYFSLVPAPEAVLTAYEGAGRVTAAVGKGYLFAYSPLGLPFTLSYDFSGATGVRAAWFDTRTGETEIFSVIPPGGKHTFAPSSCGKGQDALLILTPFQKAK